jgi:uncharacterized protein YrrD
MADLIRCQCWSQLKDSISMWSVYSNNDKAIMIQVQEDSIKGMTNSIGNVELHVKKDIEEPSDLSGVLYIPMINDQWKYKVIDELKVLGYAVSKDMI